MDPRMFDPDYNEYALILLVLGAVAATLTVIVWRRLPRFRESARRALCGALCATGLAIAGVGVLCSTAERAHYDDVAEVIPLDRRPAFVVETRAMARYATSLGALLGLLPLCGGIALLGHTCREEAG